MIIFVQVPHLPENQNGSYDSTSTSSLDANSNDQDEMDERNHNNQGSHFQTSSYGYGYGNGNGNGNGSLKKGFFMGTHTHTHFSPMQLKVKKSSNIARIKALLLQQLIEKGFQDALGGRPVDLTLNGKAVNDHTLLSELLSEIDHFPGNIGSSKHVYFDAQFPRNFQEPVNYIQIADDLDAMMGRDDSTHTDDTEDEELQFEDSGMNDTNGSNRQNKNHHKNRLNENSDLATKNSDKISKFNTEDQVSSYESYSSNGGFYQSPQYPGRTLGNLYACCVNGSIFSVYFKQEGTWKGRARHIPVVFGDPQIMDTFEVSKRFQHTNLYRKRKNENMSDSKPQHFYSDQSNGHQPSNASSPEPYNMTCSSSVIFQPQSQCWIEEQRVKTKDGYVTSHQMTLSPRSHGLLTVEEKGVSSPISLVLQEQGYNSLLLTGTNKLTGQIVFLETIALSPDFTSRVRTFQRFQDHTGKLISIIVFQEQKVMERTSESLSPVISSKSR